MKMVVRYQTLDGNLYATELDVVRQAEKSYGFALTGLARKLLRGDMKRVIRYETLDGKLHPTELDAVRHAENSYGLALTGLAHKLLRCDKYSVMMEFLNQCVEDDTFKKLLDLHGDTNSREDEDDE